MTIEAMPPVIRKILYPIIIGISGYALLYFLPFQGALPLGVFLAIWANNIEQNNRKRNE